VEISMTQAGRTHEDRFDTVAWGLLFVLVGVLALPGGVVTDVLASAVGVALIAINVARRRAGLPVRALTLALGTVTLVAGVAALAGVPLDLFAGFFVALGAIVIAGAIARRD
jgi:hypothetical protein